VVEAQVKEKHIVVWFWFMGNVNWYVGHWL